MLDGWGCRPYGQRPNSRSDHDLSPQKRRLRFVTGRLTVTAFCWIDPAENSPEDAVAFLEDLAEQADAMFADFE